MEYLELGSAPTEEECVQVSDKVDYIPAMREELIRYRKLLEKMFPSCYFSIMWFDHDFGRYGEVVVRFNPDNEEEVHYAYNVEHNLPKYWEKENVQTEN